MQLAQFVAIADLDRRQGIFHGIQTSQTLQSHGTQLRQFRLVDVGLFQIGQRRQIDLRQCRALQIERFQQRSLRQIERRNPRSVKAQIGKIRQFRKIEFRDLILAEVKRRKRRESLDRRSPLA